MCVPDFYREAAHVCQGRSKQTLRCCHCAGEIIAGDRYFAISGRWDGEFSRRCAHGVCHEIFCVCASQWRGDPAEGPSIDGGLIEDALEETIANRGAAPGYWPEGVPVSAEGLRGHVAKLRAAA
jgi:hypothetical protein